ncbi:MAG: NUDIX hydrolase [Bacteroidota bacterium]
MEKYTPTDQEEILFKEDLISFVQNHSSCFERTLLKGHITGSAWIINKDCTKALLTHHSKLDRWLQLGGHADGNSDVIGVALKEAREESGLNSIRIVSGEIFDLDIHSIPERKNEPRHLHYDLRFLFKADEHETLHVSSESKNLKWIAMNDLSKYTQHNKSILRMKEKCYKR